MVKRDRYIENETLKNYRRVLRSEPTQSEYVLWQELRKGKIKLKFRRQVSIGPFIVDFYCHQLKLIIELDGPIHDEQKDYDLKREHWLKENKYHVLRFKNDEVIFEREKTMEKIDEYCRSLFFSKD